jgi:hypothetical protein
MRKTQVTIPEQAVPAIRARLSLMEQKRIELAALETELRVLLSALCRVDLEHEQWHLDDVHFVLRKELPSGK